MSAWLTYESWFTRQSNPIAIISRRHSAQHVLCDRRMDNPPARPKADRDYRWQIWMFGYVERDPTCLFQLFAPPPVTYTLVSWLILTLGMFAASHRSVPPPPAKASSDQCPTLTTQHIQSYVQRWCDGGIIQISFSIPSHPIPAPTQFSSIRASFQSSSVLASLQSSSHLDPLLGDRAYSYIRTFTFTFTHSPSSTRPPPPNAQDDGQYYRKMAGADPARHEAGRKPAGRGAHLRHDRYCAGYRVRRSALWHPHQARPRRRRRLYAARRSGGCGLKAAGRLPMPA